MVEVFEVLLYIGFGYELSYLQPEIAFQTGMLGSTAYYM
jgi:hypothetical protein